MTKPDITEKGTDERPTVPALLCIDLQYLGTTEGYGIFENHRKTGWKEEDIQYYLDRIQKLVLPNVVKLQSAFRNKQLEVIHCRICSLTQDGRDRSPEHVRLGLHAPPHSKLAQFLPQVAPIDDELVLSKTASGIFTSTNLHYLLGNLGITNLYVAGVYTNECVSSAVRSASDLGYRPTLVSDATAAISSAMQEASLLTLKDRYARIEETDEVCEEIS
ncbi:MULTISPECIES: cysteine hydrolase family protein [Kordiimonas]|jgi:nicotinamidase-related amidase|uniref:cysteine hydrolase family protein n=1 Tax=Kordiimonas TaxID=288021 RepID=UPI00257A75E9|nr:isochorismatase family cysteine hydrolase [Kordiimonas sp. UBA4487]